MKKSLIGMVAALMFGGFAFADWLSDESLERAATSWLSSDRVARLTMKDLSFDRLIHRGSLRIVHLSPSGYIVMSGSDTSDPVISFSRNEFVEPAEGSPFYAMLEHSDSNVSKHEVDGGERTVKWTELIGNRDGSKPSARRLRTTPSEEPSTVLIAPFLTTHWNQGSPYNDFCPLSDDPQEYAHVPCGCVATAVAQQIAHFKWPWRTGMDYTYDHELDADGVDGVESRYVVRFDGHLPFDWDSLWDVYEWWWEDARGKVPESVRYPIARLIMWVDNIMFMGFGKHGSGAHFGAAWLTTLDWYEKWEWVDLINDYDVGAPKVKANIEAGVPVHVGVPGHAVVGHGWASDGEFDYVYLNYGYGGTDDGWYILGGYNADTPIFDACVGFRPKKMVQVEPLPKITENNFEVKWHIPSCYDNCVRGFEIVANEFGNDINDEILDFSRSVGVVSSPKTAYVTNHVEYIENDPDFVCDNETDFLWWSPDEAGTYDLPGERILTGSSVLSYRLSSSYIGDREVEILASFDGGEWQTVSIPLLNRRCWSKSWITQKVFLGQFAGAGVRFRIKVGWGGGRLFFDDFNISNVIQPSTVSRTMVSQNLRSYSLNGLGAGKVVGVTVKPIFDDGDGLVSECQFTQIAGMSNFPIPATCSTYKTNDVVYTNAEAGGIWGLRGMAEGETTIRAQHAWYGGFDVALPGKLTDQSELSFSWHEIGCYTLDTEYDTISATFVDALGVGRDFWVMTNQNQQTERQLVEIPLAQFAGMSGGVKIVFGHYGGNYVGDGDIMRFYSPRISNVAIPVLPKAKWESKAFTILPLPQIYSVKGHDGLEIDEGLYREIEIGEDTLRVSCSKTVENLYAYPSHLSLMNDNDVMVEKITSGEFLVRMNTAGVPRRSRMILTLLATDSNGTEAYRDISLRFDDGSSITRLDRWRRLDALSEKPMTAFTFDGSNLENSGTGDMVIGGGVFYFRESPFGYALCHDGNGGPWMWSSGEPDMPEAWTVLATAKMSETNNAVLYQFGSAEIHHCGLALASGGKDEVTLSYWHPGINHIDLFSVKVKNATSQYHSYALRTRGFNVELFVDGVFATSTVLPDMPKLILQFFCPIGGVVNTGLVVSGGQSLDDWRMYDSALPAAAIACYANMLSEFDADYPAGWRVNVVAFDANGGEVLESERTIREGSPIGELPVPVRSGYTFEGWFSAARGGDKITAATKVTADVTCYARWTRPYIVQFHKYDGSGETRNQEFKVGETKSLLWLESQLKWKREGYEFIGWVPWNPDSKARLCKYVNGQKVKDLAKEGETVHLWAAWKSSSSYRVCFHLNDGTDVKMNQVILRNKEDTLAWMDSQIGWTRPGYAFKGWTEKEGSATVKYANGAKVKNLAMDGGTKHLYAVWALKANAYVVQYHRYDGSGETREQEFKAGETKALLWLTSQLGWSREGYEFIGWVPWNPDSKARLCKYVNGQQVKDIGKPGAKVHLYAAWKSASSYRVCFHRNDGTDVKMNQVILRNKEDSLAWMDSQIGWTRSGYKFQGWAEKEGSATVKYANGAKVKNLAMDGGTKNLYAVWKAANASTKMLAFAEHESPDVVIEGEVYGGGGAFRLVVGEGGAAVLYLFDGEGWSEEKCEAAPDGDEVVIMIDGEPAYRITFTDTVPLLL